ncbi:hypothetical protein EMCRGX_G034867 [Ephydatia muelleri]
MPARRAWSYASKGINDLRLHVALQLSIEKLESFEDLARAVTWTFALGGHVVSVYDSKGNLKKDLARLRTAIVLQQEKLFGAAGPAVQVATLQDAEGFDALNKTGELFLVLVLSPEDGRQHIVETAVGVCKAVLQNRVKMEDINIDLIDRKLTATLTEPSLAIVFGGLQCSLGYPPWHLRVTEIHFLPVLRKLVYQDLYTVFQKYASCQQRLGT